ncbi:MAG TPA: integrase arm-type DNA-binding domain-containing protein [Rhizobiaceae bacterium]|nr:integrase arm-type DNA-binding domain-containing protein [Rhizobiaceae bacterium]
MLTNAAAKAAGARSRAYKLHDQGGLHLLVRPTGTKSWQMKYRWRGREKLLTIGQFPAVNVARARILQAEAKEKLERGVDPGARVEIEVNTVTIEQLARAWYQHNLTSWSPAHAADVIGSLERDVFPQLGALVPDAIAAPRLLKVLRAVEARGQIATAQRERQRLDEIFRFGIAEGHCETNPAETLGAALREPPPATPHPALTRAEDCRALLQACEAVPARPVTRLASRFLALTAVRLDSVRGMRWGELEDIDGPEPLWRVPPARLKLKRAKKAEERFEHLVPLAPAAVAVLRSAAAENGYDTRSSGDCAPPDGGLVFPGRRKNSPIGEGAIGEFYQRALRQAQDERLRGKRHVPHGWRASFSTVLNEQLDESWSAAIDAALGHAKGDKVEAAYNRAQRLGRRRTLFERWGALLTG